MMIRRRNYWIQPEFQRRMIFQWTLLVLFATAATFVVTIGFVLYQDQAGGGSFFYVKDLIGSDPVAVRRLNIAAPVLCVSGFLGFLITCLAGVFYSHRIAGPVYRIRRAVREAMEGKRPEPINLRKYDELKDLAEDLNRLFGKIHG